MDKINFFSPIFILTFSIIFLFSMIAFQKRNYFLSANMSIVSLIASVLIFWKREKNLTGNYYNILFKSRYSIFLSTLVMIVIIFSTFFLYKKIKDYKKNREEFYIFILIFSIGSYLLINSYHMMILYIGIEIISISLFGMLSFDTYQRNNNIVPCMRYTLLSTISSVFLLFGIALFYAEIRSFNYSDIRHFILNFPVLHHPIFLLGLSFVLTGIFFKLSLFPFYSWMNEIYDCISIPTYIFIGIIGKLLVFLTIILLFIHIPILMENRFSILMEIVSGISILYSGIYSIIQKKMNIKNILKVFFVNYCGYITIGFCLLNFLEKTGKEYINLFRLINLNLINYFLSNIGIVYLLTNIKEDFSCEEKNILITKKNFFRKKFFDTDSIRWICMVVIIFSLSGLPILITFFKQSYLSLLINLQKIRSTWIIFSYIIGFVINTIYLIYFVIWMIQIFYFKDKIQQNIKKINTIPVIIAILNIILFFITVNNSNLSLSKIEKIFSLQEKITFKRSNL